MGPGWGEAWILLGGADTYNLPDAWRGKVALSPARKAQLLGWHPLRMGGCWGSPCCQSHHVSRGHQPGRHPGLPHRWQPCDLACQGEKGKIQGRGGGKVLI